MDKDVCIEKICLLPLNVKLEQKSASQLLAESLYYIFSETISIEDIKTHLNNAPHLIDHLDWMVIYFYMRMLDYTPHI